MLSSSRDNWARLVTAVVKRQQIWELCHQQSFSTIAASDDDLSQQTLSFSSSNFESFSVPPSPRLPPKLPPISQVSNHGSSKSLTQKLFSVWYRIRKSKDQDLVGIPEDIANHLWLLQRFSLDGLRVATRDFSKRIGWDVYRGWLADGSPVAVKRTPKKSIRRIQVEIFRHTKVIHILGFCITPDEVLLVYPLMVNGSVASRIWEDIANHLGLLQSFSLDELRVARRDFSKRIGLDVYRGWLADGSQVAVKRRQKRIDELRSEVLVNSIVAHPNVIHILGSCITPYEVLLVYPWMVNGSVESCIWGRDESKAPLNWPTRQGIALGAARGLAYLHEEIHDMKIIHLDIKPSNILLDEDFRAVVADFGLAIVAERDAPNVQLRCFSGTHEYMCPEFLLTGKCSEKNDVYSYGVLLLALISGRNPITQSHEGVPLRDLVKSKYMECKWEEIVDAKCTFNYMEDEVKLLVQIALLCTIYDPQKRPKMSEIVRVIEDGDDLVDQRLEEWIKDEVENEKKNDFRKKAPWEIDDDDTFDLAAEELSGPR